MTQLGKVIVDEPFTAASWQKNWGKSWQRGDWQIIGDYLRVVKKSQENHHPEIGFAPKNIGGKALHNEVVHCKFKYNSG